MDCFGEAGEFEVAGDLLMIAVRGWSLDEFPFDKLVTRSGLGHCPVIVHVSMTACVRARRYAKAAHL